MSRNGARRWWQLLLAVHIILYASFFIIALTNFNFVWYMSQNNFIFLMFWTPLLLIHVGLHFYHAGRGIISHLERQAYRDGVADALRQLGERSEFTERLALDDEGEFVQIEGKRKR
jgi:succinate dehydrogenase hydrophobic anchor subunit